MVALSSALGTTGGFAGVGVALLAVVPAAFQLFQKLDIMGTANAI